MLSTFPPTFSGDSLLGNPFPPFEPAFPFLFHLPEQHSPSLSQEPVTSNSGSYPLNPTPSPRSDNSNRTQSKTSGSGSGSDDENGDKFNKKKGCGCNDVVDERKRRRMLSNRESARRSRMRKQKHLENLRNQANRLRLGNREQANRLRFIVYQTERLRRENECLRNEETLLRHRLSEIRQVLVLQQLLNNMPMQNNIPTI